MELFENITYNRLDLNFVHSRFIREYDIRKANISILYNSGIIDEATYTRLYNSTRAARQIEIGLMIKYDSELYKALAAGIIEAKHKLFTMNDIKDYEVLSIKNDAVFILDRQLQYTEVDKNIVFVQKNTYTSYIRFSNKVEIFYGLDKIGDNEKVDVKGIGDETLRLHKDYFLDFIVFILSSVETESIDEVISSFKDFYNSYVSLSLPIEYYREFNSDSKYRIINTIYAASVLADTDKNKRLLDISYNLTLLREIYGYLVKTFFEVKKK